MSESTYAQNLIQLLTIISNFNVKYEEQLLHLASTHFISNFFSRQVNIKETIDGANKVKG